MLVKQSIIIGSRYQSIAEPLLKLNLNNIQVDQVRETKLLGIILDHNLSRPKQTDHIVSKMGRGVSVVRRVLKVMPPNVIKHVLNALVLSV